MHAILLVLLLLTQKLHNQDAVQRSSAAMWALASQLAR
jgi:hypothetical protein